MSLRPDYGTGFLRAQREAMGLTITDMARACGVTPGHLSNIEAGRRHPTPELARTIAYHLGVPLDAMTDPAAWGVAA